MLPPTTRRASLPGGSGAGGASTAPADATAAGLLLEHMYVLVCISVHIWSQNVRRLDDSPLPRRLWLAGRGCAGKEGPARLFLSSPLAAARLEAWLEGLLLRLALAGPAGDLKNALPRRRLGCSVADCA